MKVARLPVDPGPAGWNALLPEGPAPRVLQDKVTVDWLVIGAGFAGLAAARRLSQLQPGARIAVVDATRVGEGPAGRNSGFMIDLPHDLSSGSYAGGLEGDRAQTRLNRDGIAFAGEAAAEYDMSAEAYTVSGKINAAATARGHQHNLDYARHLGAMDEPFELLDATKMQEVTGSTYYQSGLFTPGSAMIQPALYVRSLARGLASDRVQLFENSPVTGLSRGADWVATTPKGQVTAPRVILAVNGHINSFGYFPGRLMHVFTYASMTRPLTGDEVAELGGAPIWGATSADPMGSTIRRISGEGGDRIVVRNRFTFDPSLEVPGNRVAQIARDHDRALAARFPTLNGIEMSHRWGGRLCLSRNNVQIVRQLDEGLFAACCQNGLGTAKGTLAGKLAAELACNVSSDGLAAVLGHDAPSRLPPAPIARLGAQVVIRWQEWRAGREL